MKLSALVEGVEQKSEDFFVTNIEDDTIENDDFRRVLFTAEGLQLVLMSIPPDGDIGMEKHDSVDQFFRVDKGEGKLVVGDKEEKISNGSAFIVPRGTEHNVVNTSKTEDLKLYTLYSPPNHQKDVVHKTKEDAEKSKEHFDDKTDT